MRVTAAILAAVASSSAQTAAPAFEAASIKLSKPGSSGRVTVTATEYIWSDATLRQLIKAAFNVKDYSLAAPESLNSTGFDIVAKIPAGTPPGGSPKMLQTLLVERFKLTYHFEPRTANGYALVLAKEGLKIHPLESTEQHGTMGPDRMIAKLSLAGLAGMLSSRLNLPVADETGVAGVFDFNFKWTPEPGAPNLSPGAPPDTAADPGGPSLFVVLQEQLGLKLEPRKLPVDVMVIDHAEKMPIEN